MIGGISFCYSAYYYYYYFIRSRMRASELSSCAPRLAQLAARTQCVSLRVPDPPLAPSVRLPHTSARASFELASAEMDSLRIGKNLVLAMPKETPLGDRVTTTASIVNAAIEANDVNAILEGVEPFQQLILEVVAQRGALGEHDEGLGPSR